MICDGRLLSFACKQTQLKFYVVFPQVKLCKLVIEVFIFNREEEFIEIETYFSLSYASLLNIFATEDEEACKKELAINYLSHAGYLHLSSSSPLTIDREWTAKRQVVSSLQSAESWNVEKLLSSGKI